MLQSTMVPLHLFLSILICWLASNPYITVLLCIPIALSTLTHIIPCLWFLTGLSIEALLHVQLYKRLKTALFLGLALSWSRTSFDH